MNIAACEADARASGAQNGDPVWRAVLKELGVTINPGETSFRAIHTHLDAPGGPEAAIIFDNCDALPSLPAVWHSWLAAMHVLSQLQRTRSRCLPVHHTIGNVYTICCCP